MGWMLRARMRRLLGFAPIWRPRGRVFSCEYILRTTISLAWRLGVLFTRKVSAHFASALFYMFDVVRSILLCSWRRYDYVVFVRYLMGTAYLPSPLHKVGYCFFATVVPTSDFMFFLDVSPEEAYRRIRETRGEREMFEGLDELRFVRGKALSLLSMGGWVVVDGDKPPDSVEEEIRGSLKLRL